jgi:hypothetical protein
MQCFAGCRTGRRRSTRLDQSPCLPNHLILSSTDQRALSLFLPACSLKCLFFASEKMRNAAIRLQAEMFLWSHRIGTSVFCGMQNGAAAVHSLRPVTLSSQSSDTILYFLPACSLKCLFFASEKMRNAAIRLQAEMFLCSLVLLRQVKNGRRIERKESDRTDRVRGRGVGESERERERKPCASPHPFVHTCFRLQL